MKSIVKTHNSQILIMVLALLLLTAGIVFLVVQNMAHAQLESDYRQMLSQINGIISELNEFEGPLTQSDRLLNVNEALGELLAFWDDKRIGQGMDQKLILLQERLISGRSTAEEGIREVGGMARSLGNAFYATTEQMRSHSLVIMVLVLTVAIFMAIWLVLMGRWITGSLTWIRQVIGKLSSTLAYNEIPEVRPPRWTEEEVIDSIVNSTIEQVVGDRRLLEYTIHGTLDDVFPIIKEIIQRQMPCNRLAIAFINQLDEVTAETALTDYHNIHLHQGYSEPIDASSLAKLRDMGQPRIIDDLMQHYQNVHKSQGSRLILEEGLQSSLTLPMVVQGRCRGFVFISSTQKHAYTLKHQDFAQRLLQLLGGTIYHKYSNEQTIATTASGFVKLMEKKDNETSKHILRMSRYSYILAKQLYRESHPQVTHRMLRDILLFAPLHDIGKIAIPDSILLKPGKLDPQEMGIMKGHVNEGQDVLEQMNQDLQNYTGAHIMDSALNIIAGHHEKFDGSGYPKGLKGEDIPIEGRIVAVADVFDALTSKRPYKEAWSIERATAMIKEQSGQHFDPLVVQALFDALEEIKEVYWKYKEV
jgi:HD-GYP domain-containing protein (c-di-GMP phosphodiesterase class II)